MWGWNIFNNINIFLLYVNFIILYEWFYNKILFILFLLEIKEFDLFCFGLIRVVFSMVSFNLLK